MSTALPLANSNRIEALTSRVDDLERVLGVLIIRLTDLETVVSLIRPLPADHGRKKVEITGGATMAVNAPGERLRSATIES